VNAGRAPAESSAAGPDSEELGPRDAAASMDVSGYVWRGANTPATSSVWWGGANGMSDPDVRHTDEDLMRRSAAGDRVAFEELVGRHGDALYRFALRTCRNERDAEDAVQDGLLAAWRGAAGFRGESAARTWLFQVVIHACRRSHRRRAGEPESLDPMDAAASIHHDGPPPDGHAAAREVGAALAAALAAMSDEGREVLVLRDVEGLDGAEAAVALGIGIPAMKSRLHRARLELKERVEQILGHPVNEIVS
jgi:RNA polymerase sigma-70 factor, ECF subfamily